MPPNIRPKRSDQRRNPLPQGGNPANAIFEFGRFRLLPRRRQLLADGAPVDLGVRAFDLLVVLLEADGALVTKEELLKNAWRGMVVSEGNLKVQVSALRKAFGPDRDLVRTETGRGYRFTGALRSSALADPPERLAQTKPSFGRSWRHQKCLYEFRAMSSRPPAES